MCRYLPAYHESIYEHDLRALPLLHHFFATSRILPYGVVFRGSCYPNPLAHCRLRWVLMEACEELSLSRILRTAERIIGTVRMPELAKASNRMVELSEPSCVCQVPDNVLRFELSPLSLAGIPSTQTQLKPLGCCPDDYPLTTSNDYPSDLHWTLPL